MILEVMEPLAVDLSTLVRALDNEIRIMPGRVLAARVIEVPDQNGRGTLSLAGMILEAQLPRDVEHGQSRYGVRMIEGQTLRLTVHEVTPQRVVLTLGSSLTPEQMPSVVPLPGGASVTVDEDDQQTKATGKDGQTTTVSLRFNAPTLGRIDMRLNLAEGTLRADVAVSSNVLERAGAVAPELRDSIATAASMPAEVSISARRDPLDVYA